LPQGQERNAARSATTGKFRDEPLRQKAAARRVAPRPPAALRRSADAPTSPFAARLADRLAGCATQTVQDQEIML
jgi:hypothetical protein